MTEAAAIDPRIVCLTADLGYKLFDNFAARFPGRFMNVGVAEANMVGMAAGMALEGKRPFVYSIVPFAALRCYEQIRNDVCYHNLDVVVVGIGGGYSYGQNGPTHHGLEDIAALRAIPNLAVVCPGDPIETTAAVHAILKTGGPTYLRLGRAGEPTVHTAPVDFAQSRSIVLRDGGEVALLTTGNTLKLVVDAADALAQKGVKATVVSMPWVKPFDGATLARVTKGKRLIATFEEHNTLGGFGGAVCEVIASEGGGVPVMRFGAQDTFSSLCGDQAYHRDVNGLTVAAICAKVLAKLA
jgi:transketolase